MEKAVYLPIMLYNRLVCAYETSSLVDELDFDEFLIYLLDEALDPHLCKDCDFCEEFNVL